MKIHSGIKTQMTLLNTGVIFSELNFTKFSEKIKARENLTAQNEHF